MAEHRVAGRWRGALTTASGSTELIITVTELPDGRHSALLDVPLQRLSRVPLTVVLTTDSTYFTATRPALRFAGRWTADNKLLGTWFQNGSPNRVTLSHVAAPNPVKAVAPPYQSESVRFTNAAAAPEAVASAGTNDKDKAGLVLAGTLTRPTGQGPFPAVLLLSDLGPQDRDATYDGYRFFAELADYLTRAGFAVLRYDDRGVGQSTGNLMNATTAELATDAQAGLYFLRARPDVDVTHIGLLGHGEGANVALLAAGAALPPNFVVALAGYGVPGREILVQQQTHMLQEAGAEPAQVDASIRRQRDILDIVRNMTDRTQTQAIVANMLRQDSPGLDQASAQTSAAHMLTRSYRAFVDFDPQAQLSQVHCPVLLLGGTADEQVNTDINLAALQKGLRNAPSVKLVKLPGVNHLLQPNAREWPIIGGQASPVPAADALTALQGWLRLQTAP